MAYLLLALALSGATGADENSAEKSIKLPEDNAMAELKPGPGVEIVRADCIACHSTDYIVRQPGSDVKQWGAEVRKMIGTFGAPISEVDEKAIVKYLASAYGRQTEAEAAGEGGKRGAPGPKDKARRSRK